MKRISIKLAVATLTFLIGVVVAAIWTFQKPLSKESPSVELVASVPLSFCDLIQAPDRFKSQQIRVEANLIGFHETALYGPRCGNEDNHVRADFDVTSRKQLIESVARLNRNGLHRGNFWIHVILSGRFEKIAEADRQAPRQLSNDRKYIEYHYRLVVSSVEKVVAVSDDAPSW